jgi:hypothetical protein
MSDLKPTGTKILLGKNEYGMRFTLNAIEDIQEHFDIPISRLAELFKDERKQIKNLKYLLAILINEDMDCETGEKAQHVEERFVGRYITPQNMKSMMSTIFKAFSDGTPETEEDDLPNAQSE